MGAVPGHRRVGLEQRDEPGPPTDGAKGGGGPHRGRRTRVQLCWAWGWGLSALVWDLGLRSEQLLGRF